MQIAAFGPCNTLAHIVAVDAEINLHAAAHLAVGLAQHKGVGALGADGVVISDGAGDPCENMQVIEEIKKILGKTVVLGIGQGHLLVAVALGAKTKKQKYGHRGSNQPVKCVKCGKVAISSQNHGYEVVAESIQEGVVSHINVNDNSCEGIEYEGLKAFTVQFAPEAYSIGNPTNPLYDKFFALMEKEKENA